ncbi:MAG: bifunctional 5,10-methylenetetrahydrofolate dehydrogenase/5,10-methenyltetrahydrofolate cyclohydrolase [Candidatus Pacebacteria bacterium]|nr:bifunctional 5,10-methylenetetrahydrofolate dehydrogenase/5,10-methenyltetrahydrofolate cyclohydrolase [Candidatus Paceibacterota bacterium]MBP9839557.1 bifunctional 5,10-methylenetetrahydrofolate dehydrogenase/5,10-methenyltetrahydrofolate cyclohydrolase [Candidatus Paceibacterota bacterium]
MKKIDGRKLRSEILETIKGEVGKLPFRPVFCDVLVGDDPASFQYVKMKAQTAESVGISFHSANFPKDITTEKLQEELKNINKIKNMCGIIIQLPLPPHIDKRAVLDAIDPKLDVDCLGLVASDEFYQGKEDRIKLGFPTALACIKILDSLNLELNNKKIVVLGQGMLVGKPVSALLSFRGLETFAITSKTENKEELIKSADIIISGIGQGRFIKSDMVKDGVVLIDAGTSESNGGIVGDVDLDTFENKEATISPVPGGVGPVTVAMLLYNVLQVAKSDKWQ